jgi:isoaspartyl peptidase/L-asparaginase-like protein (Ntn-hydrolase superfamily)
MNKISIAIHRGADNYLTQLHEEAPSQRLKIYFTGGSYLDAVAVATASLEDFPLFKSGQYAVFNIQGKYELVALLAGDQHNLGARQFIRLLQASETFPVWVKNENIAETKKSGCHISEAPASLINF